VELTDQSSRRAVAVQKVLVADSEATDIVDAKLFESGLDCVPLHVDDGLVERAGDEDCTWVRRCARRA
jgi:hypothetical protein